MKNSYISQMKIKEIHKAGYTGYGVNVAVLDSGSIEHMDFQGEKGSRIISFFDAVGQRTKPYDDNGHGTHISGILCGNGRSSEGLYMGIAPKCNLIPVKVLDHNGKGSIANMLQGIEWVLQNKEKYNIQILNISIGTLDNDIHSESSKLVQGVEKAWNAGIVVIVAAGNNGPRKMTITTPGISRKVITVGTSDDTTPMRINNSMVKNYSGRGPTLTCIMKPDLVAPGSNITACSNDTDDRSYTTKSGTSMSTPIVSGAIALLLQRYPHMTNTEVKLKLRDSTIDLGQERSRQGWGLLDIRKLLM